MPLPKIKNPKFTIHLPLSNKTYDFDKFKVSQIKKLRSLKYSTDDLVTIKRLCDVVYESIVSEDKTTDLYIMDLIYCYVELLRYNYKFYFDVGEKLTTGTNWKFSVDQHKTFDIKFRGEDYLCRPPKYCYLENITNYTPNKYFAMFFDGFEDMKEQEVDDFINAISPKEFDEIVSQISEKNPTIIAKNGDYFFRSAKDIFTRISLHYYK